MANRIIRVIGLVALGLLLLSCATEFGQVTPTIGPVRDGSSRAGFARIELISSTNCAEIGEAVTFTVRIVNETTTPMTITGTPPIDIVLHPAQWPFPGPPPTQRWSQSSQYPANLNSVLTPSEERVYQWQWAADAVYGRDGVRGIEAQASAALLESRATIAQAAGANLHVGIVSIPWGNHGEFLCARMLR